MTLRTPLAEAHQRAGATFTDFAGWQMPVRYTSDLAEHQAVRTAAGLFDLSHMGEIRITGPDAAAYLDTACAGRLSNLEIGQARYTLLLNADGGIIDDIIVYRCDDADFLAVANAGNRHAALDALKARTDGFDVTVADESEETALIAVQGPAAQTIVEAVGLESEPLSALRSYRALEAVFEGEDILVARTGYTGEDGFELYLPNHVAEPLWESLLRVGEPHGLQPCGLASRDTLRLEAGMPLYGSELSRETLPVQAGPGRVVSLQKDADFVGRAAVEAGPAPDAPVLIALVTEGRRAPRAGYPVFDGETEVGRITSGALSPTLGHPIAMAYVAPESKDSSQLAVDVRGTRIPATVTRLPFYKREA